MCWSLEYNSQFFENVLYLLTNILTISTEIGNTDLNIQLATGLHYISYFHTIMFCVGNFFILLQEILVHQYVENEIILKDKDSCDNNISRKSQIIYLSQNELKKEGDAIQEISIL